jgi:hypothetical protein
MLQHDGSLLLDQCPEKAVPFWQVADLPHHVVGHTHVDELLQ